jgi:hypothetical protein
MMPQDQTGQDQQTVNHNGRKKAQPSVAASLATGRTVLETPQETKVSPTTIHRWLREDPSFRAMIADLRKQAVSEAINLTSSAARSAAITLLQLLRVDHPPTRLGAAKEILRFAHENILLEELQDRLVEVEGILKARGGTTP